MTIGLALIELLLFYSTISRAVTPLEEHLKAILLLQLFSYKREPALGSNVAFAVGLIYFAFKHSKADILVISWISTILVFFLLKPRFTIIFYQFTRPLH